MSGIEAVALTCAIGRRTMLTEVALDLAAG
ncbi:hypothetical protein DFQ13_104591 [Actinokineospora spheciospongiae]|nr:hypothetical protein DFQ13_104591 [Actinokineospora spheciospongiae]